MEKEARLGRRVEVGEHWQHVVEQVLGLRHPGDRLLLDLLGQVCIFGFTLVTTRLR